jgi:hypothetical protein
MSVRPELVAEFLVDGLHRAAAEVEAPSLPAGELATLAEPDEEAAATILARDGYRARVAEWNRFERAREPVPWLDDALRERAADDLCAELARREPAGKPAPDDPDAVTWRIPGPGGHVRHMLFVRAHAEQPALPAEDAKRCWTYGFLARCCEEAAER